MFLLLFFFFFFSFFFLLLLKVVLDDAEFVDYMNVDGDWSRHAVDDSGAQLSVPLVNPVFNRVVGRCFLFLFNSLTD